MTCHDYKSDYIVFFSFFFSLSGVEHDISKSKVLRLRCLRQNRLREPMVYCYACLGWISVPWSQSVWKKSWKDHERNRSENGSNMLEWVQWTSESLFNLFNDSCLSRYFVARAWCQDRLTIEDAKALSVLWKQLTRGAATGLQFRTLSASHG